MMHTILFGGAFELMMNILLYRCFPERLREGLRGTRRCERMTTGEAEVRGMYSRIARDVSVRSEVFVHDVVECSFEGGHAMNALISRSSAFERRRGACTLSPRGSVGIPTPYLSSL